MKRLAPWKISIGIAAMHLLFAIVGSLIGEFSLVEGLNIVIALVYVNLSLVERWNDKLRAERNHLLERHHPSAMLTTPGLPPIPLCQTCSEGFEAAGFTRTPAEGVNRPKLFLVKPEAPT